MKRACILVMGVLLLPFSVFAQDWEPAIEAFEKRDAENPPAKGGILFVGSSSIRFWDTDAAFPDHGILNRGFGGSQTADVVQYMERIVLPYEPRLIVFYAGDNDIALGKTPDQVIADTKIFLDRVRKTLPDTRVVYIAIKPSLARWEMVDDMRAVNAAVAELAESDPKVDYLDVDTPMIGEDGKPRPELFIADGLHLSEAGYAIWNDLIRPLLGEPAPE